MLTLLKGAIDMLYPTQYEGKFRYDEYGTWWVSELDTPEGMKPWKLRQDTRKKVFDEGNALLEVQANMEVLLGVTITYDRSSVGWRVEGARQEYPHQVPWILSRQLELLLIRDTRDQIVPHLKTE